MYDRTPPNASPRVEKIDDPYSEPLPVSDSADAPSERPYKRNDSVSPIVIIALVLFWVAQSSLTGVISRAMHPHHGVSVASHLSGDMPSELASGIPEIEITAKQSYLDLPSAHLVAIKPGKGAKNDALNKLLANTSPLNTRRDALKKAGDLLAKYPDQSILARSVILLRAETGDTNPLSLPGLAQTKALVPDAASNKAAGAHSKAKLSKPLNPLAAYDPIPGESAGRTKLRVDERQIMVELFSTTAPISRATEADVRQRIRQMPQMRWWGQLALHQSALRAGDTIGAAGALAQIKKEATASSAGITVVTFIEFGAALTGLVCLFILLMRWLSRDSNAIGADYSILAPNPPLVADEQRRLGAGDLANLFLVYLALMTVLSFAVSNAPHDVIRRAVLRLPYEQQLTAIIAVEFALTAVCGALTLAAMFWLARRRGASLAREIGLNLGGRSILRTAGFGFIGWSISLPLSIIVVLIGQKLFHGAPEPANPIIPLMMSTPNGLPMLLMYILAAFLAPFFEETMFRGLFFNAARLRLGTTGAILLTGAAFGLAHPVGIAEQFALATLGAVFAWMAYTKKSLLPGMFAHFYQNTFVFGNMLFSMLMVSRPHLL